MKKNLTDRFLNNFSISKKMMLIFVGCAVVPLLILNIFYYGTTEKNIQDGVIQKLTQSLTEKTNKVNGLMSGVTSLSLRYNSNERLYQFLDTNYSSDINYFINYQDNMESGILTDLAVAPQVSQIILYSDNPTVWNGALARKMPSNGYGRFGEKLVNYSIHKLTSSSSGAALRVALNFVQATKSYNRSVSIIKPLEYYPKYSKYKKAIRIDINLSYLSSILKESDLFDNIILVDSSNRIIASSNTYNDSGKYDIFSKKKLKKGVVVLKQHLADVPLSLYGYYDTNLISKEFNNMRYKSILITLGSIMLALFSILLVASNITKRTKLVVNLSQSIAEGNFIRIDQSNVGRDEIGVLADSINQMSFQLQTLIDDKYKSHITKARLEKETAQAKLLALQSQVNPHFMFNTLECIRLKAIVKGEAETAKIIMYVSRMFRHLINWDEDIIFLREDIRFLEEFLYVQKYRFEDEFEYTITVDQAAQNCLVPKLVIQPLVENACLHGIESISQNKRIEIKISAKIAQLYISISDNGMGMGEEELLKVKSMLNEGEKLTNSVGLYNVYQRLCLYYGDNFTMDVQSQKGQGTVVNIVVPLRYSKEEF